jgi:hypothetical protein
MSTPSPVVLVPGDAAVVPGDLRIEELAAQHL